MEPLSHLILRAVATNPPLTPTQISALIPIYPFNKVFSMIQILMDRGDIRFNAAGTGLLRAG